MQVIDRRSHTRHAVCFVALMCATSAFGQTIFDGIYTEHKPDGSALVGIFGCVRRLQAEYSHGGGEHEVTKVKLGFRQDKHSAGRLRASANGRTYDLGVLSPMSFWGGGYCRATIAHVGVEVPKGMFLELGNKGLRFYIEDREVHIDRPLLQQFIRSVKELAFDH